MFAFGQVSEASLDLLDLLDCPDLLEQVDSLVAQAHQGLPASRALQGSLVVPASLVEPVHPGLQGSQDLQVHAGKQVVRAVQDLKARQDSQDRLDSGDPRDFRVGQVDQDSLELPDPLASLDLLETQDNQEDLAHLVSRVRLELEAELEPQDSLEDPEDQDHQVSEQCRKNNKPDTATSVVASFPIMPNLTVGDQPENANTHTHAHTDRQTE